MPQKNSKTNKKSYDDIEITTYFQSHGGAVTLQVQEKNKPVLKPSRKYNRVKR